MDACDSHICAEGSTANIGAVVMKINYDKFNKI